MRLIVPLLILAAWTLPHSDAQPICPSIRFKNTASARLSPSATTRLNLVRQADGSYTSYETSNSAPYALLSISQHFENQLESCLPAAPAAQNPAPIAPANPLGVPSEPQAVALLNSGGYLIVSPNSAGTLDAAVFDPQMKLISIQSYAAGVGLGGLTTVGLLAGVGLADVNGDGNPDIVFITSGFVDEANQQPGQLTILLGKGGSSFGSPISYPIPPTGAQVYSFAIGDLNGDHKLDIAIGAAYFGGDGGNVLTFLGNGDGTFQAGPVTTLQGAPESIALADLNGDGKLDFAAVVSNNNFIATIPDGISVATALGNGDGTFAAPSFTQTLGGSVAVGDMNNDGIPDVVTSGTILFGDGKGGFPNRQDYNVNGSGSVILADFNGDGRMDIVLAGGTPALLTEVPGSTITVLFALPNGTFFGPPVSIVPALAQPDSFISDLHTADFNGDGIPDLVYAGDVVGMAVMLGKGDGTFAPSFSSSASQGWEIATGDFNGDGHQDVVTVFGYVQGQPGVFTFFAGKGDGTFQAPLTTSIPSGPVSLVAGDFNADGKLDVAVLFSTGNSANADTVTIYLGNGDGTFHQGASYPAGPVSSWILAGDLNNDGKLDLVVTNAGSETQMGNVTTLLGKGDGTFVQATQVPLAVSNAGDDGPNTMTLADFNLDGNLDLAVTLGTPQNSTTGFAILLGKGNGTFHAPIINPLAADSIAAADLNGDGIPDLMAIMQASGSASSGLDYLLGNGDGSFQPPIGLSLYPENDNTGPPLLMADLNGDGKPDLVSLASALGFSSLLNLTAGPPPFRIISAASFALGPVAADAFVSAFGTNLPASMTGLSIQVTDSAGVARAAEPLYASATQLNFLMPAGTSNGVATVSLTSPAIATPLVSQVDIVPVAPGLFAENATGLAAAYAVRIDAQGNQTYEPAFTAQNGTVVATPIDLGTSTDQVYLSLFGTGFDQAAMASVTATIAGRSAPVSYSGPQGLAGLDQVNVLIPHQLAGSGSSPVVLSTAGSKANTVYITVQ